MATNYEKYFGDPRRAAETILIIADKCADPDFGADACDGCLLADEPCCCIDSMLKWMQSEAGE